MRVPDPEETVFDEQTRDHAAAPAPDSPVTQVAGRVFREMEKVLVGQHDLQEALIVALLARGHILLEGVPGTAKTLAVRAFAHLCRVSFARIQFTPDLMPSDLVGTNVYNQQKHLFELRKGPIFAGIVLADEVNRTPPKTQAALLEAMEERQATIDGVSHPLPDPFLVCATQNPIEYEGTYPLPEAQLDRFMMKVLVTYPELDDEVQILARRQAGFDAADLATAHLEPVIAPEDLPVLRGWVQAVTVTPAVQKYIVEIARAVRANRHAVLGPSPRASVTLMMAAKALAAVRGRDFVTPDDVKSLALPVLRHRIILKPESEIEGYSADRVLRSVLESVEVPR
ncbi:MAG: AAA family ATPase [Chthonomonadales bacterium]